MICDITNRYGQLPYGTRVSIPSHVRQPIPAESPLLRAGLPPYSPNADALRQRRRSCPHAWDSVPLLLLWQERCLLCRCSWQYHFLPGLPCDSGHRPPVQILNPIGLGWNDPKMPYRGTSSVPSRKPAVWAGSHGPSLATNARSSPSLRAIKIIDGRLVEIIDGMVAA